MDKLLLAIRNLQNIGNRVRAERIHTFKSVYADKSKYGKTMPDRNVDREAWLYARPEVLDVVSMLEGNGVHEMYTE